MKTRKMFKTGHAVVVAIPAEYRAALRLYPGTPVCLSVRDRCIVISKASIVPENMLAADVAAGATVKAPKE